jgi:hypothetical protein
MAMFRVPEHRFFSNDKIPLKYVILRDLDNPSQTMGGLSECTRIRSMENCMHHAKNRPALSGKVAQ